MKEGLEGEPHIISLDLTKPQRIPVRWWQDVNKAQDLVETWRGDILMSTKVLKKKSKVSFPTSRV